MRPRLLGRLAAERVLNGGLDVAKRLEKAAIEGIKTGDWAAVRRSLKLRKAMKLKPDAATAFQIERILRLVDEAERDGIGGTGEVRVGACDGGADGR